MSGGFPAVPGVPAAGHVARNGYWHPGTDSTCQKSPCAESRRPQRAQRALGRMPRAGDRFEYTRWIHGSPREGTATPAICEITRIDSGTAWYGPIRDLATGEECTPGGFRIALDRLDEIARRWLTEQNPTGPLAKSTRHTKEIDP